MTKEELEKEATEYALEWGTTTDGTYACCRDGYLAGAEPRERRIAELEKENAELKKKSLNAQDAVTMQMYTNRANKEIADRQLTKAKEIITDMLRDIPNRMWYTDDVIKRAEDFIKE